MNQLDNHNNQDNLKAENEMLLNILTNMPGNVYWKNKDHYYLGCNHNAAQLAGLKSPQELKGKRIEDIFCHEVAKQVIQTDNEIMLSVEGKYFEESGIDATGKQAIYLSHKIPLCDSLGNVIGLLGASFDITDRKKMEQELKIAKEQAEAANIAKTEFVTTVNHELRTPLAGMQGLIEFLKKDDLPCDEKNKYLMHLEKNIQYLLGLINSVLDFSQLEMNKRNLNLSHVNLESLAKNIQSLLQPLARNKNLQFSIIIDPYLPKIIWTDPGILQQILINLIGNAIKFTQKGFITLKLVRGNHTENKHQISFKITDTGSGIPADKLKIIFEAFEQLRNQPAEPNSRGTGLGLSIVKKLAKLINADIQVLSELGKGSTFTLTGEFETRDDVHKTQQNTPQYVHTDIKTFKPKILLIEDNPLIQFIHEKMLTDMGCLVEVASDGSEGLNKLNKHHLILTDISLPDISGLDVIRQIRKNPLHRNIPIVALTAAEDSKEEKAICINAGANDFKVKPIAIDQLKALVIHYMNF